MLTRDALAEGAITYIGPEDLQRRQLEVLSQQLIDKEASVQMLSSRLITVGPAKFSPPVMLAKVCSPIMPG